MRLLKVETNVLDEFFGADIPKYAILSHTWGAHEVSFQDMQQGQIPDKAKASMAKIRRACNQAALDGLAYVWVDTCCIDKSSSAELSEALNSMYHWYQKAEVCYAFLSDVGTFDVCAAAGSEFRSSRWFTRGWTLQELLAPAEVIFYSSDWVKLGTKTELRGVTAEITRIDENALGGNDLDRFSIAHRMSWASSRVTTRVEDMAYCLLGIFGVNMAMLYGEGEQAFIRLQEEIIKNSEDHSIFAWIAKGAAKNTQRGFLADSPREFEESGDITSFQEVSSTSIPYSMTNKGLCITLNIVPTEHTNEYIVALNCPGLDSGSVIGIRVKRLASIGDRYCRVGTGKAEFVSIRAGHNMMTLFIQQRTIVDPSLEPPSHSPYNSLLIYNSTIYCLHEIFDKDEKLIPRRQGLVGFEFGRDKKPVAHREERDFDEVMISEGTDGWIAALSFTDPSERIPYFRVSVGFTEEFGACAFLDPSSLFMDPYFFQDKSGPSVLEGEIRHYNERDVVRIVIKVSQQQGGDKKVLVANITMG